MPLPETASSEPILTTRRDSIAVVVLNNPARLNALTIAMWARLGAVMRELDRDDTLRAVVLRGAGGQSFAAGADISEFRTARANSAQAKTYGATIDDTMQAVARWHKQFIERLTTRANVSPEEWEEAFACFDTEDFREGLDAFIGKRKPRFAGN